MSGRASNKEAYYQGVKSGSNSMYLLGIAVGALGSHAAASGKAGFAAGAGASVTGAGALAGVPAMTISAGVIALGSGVAVSGVNISMTSQNSLNQAREKLNELADQGDSGAKSIEDILEDATETTSHSGVARNFEKSGGYEKTLEDFEALNPSNVKDIQTQYGPGKVGYLEDGTTVVARPGSTTGGATLEIRVSNSKVYKIRY